MQLPKRLDVLMALFRIVSLLSELFRLGLALNTTEYDSSHALQKEFPSKCYDLLGCFETGGRPFYDPPNRPIVLLPFDMEHLKTKFLLFTPSSRMDPRQLNFTGESLSESGLDPLLDTKVIVPGFATFLHRTGLINGMKNALLESGDYNVILLDWSSSNQPPYLQAVANARVVAAQLAHFIDVLKTSLGLSPRSVHLIGHSLGSHLAGMAGKRTEGLGRITGLDPAGPYFYKADPRTRLDADDADFVDVIYTNGGSNYIQGLGLNEPIGHVNFYPNGGSKQPGCHMLSEDDLELDFDPYANGCSHQRVLSLYTSSIQNPQCRFWASQCLSFEHFASGRCEKSRRRKSADTAPMPRIQMGFHTLKPQHGVRGLKYFLRTGPKPPYCLNRTDVSISV